MKRKGGAYPDGVADDGKPVDEAAKWLGVIFLVVMVLYLGLLFL